MGSVVMGAGRSGLAAARFLAAQGRPVVLTDSRPDPGPALEIELAKAGIPGVWGDHPLVLLEDCDELIISPGIPRTTPFVVEALARGVPVIGEVEVAHRLLRERKDGSRVLAVTGTNGKSTTTDLIAHLLKACDMPAVACGNLGTPLITAMVGAEAGTRFADAQRPGGGVAGRAGALVNQHASQRRSGSHGKDHSGAVAQMQDHAAGHA